jgi:hypothetical protein
MKEHPDAKPFPKNFTPPEQWPVWEAKPIIDAFQTVDTDLAAVKEKAE